MRLDRVLLTLLLTTATAAQGEALKGRELARHVLNRVSWGPLPGQVDQVAKQGPMEYLRRQLDPASIDDRDCEARLSLLQTEKLSMDELMARYPNPQQDKMLRRVLLYEPATYDAKASMSQGEAFRAIREILDSMREAKMTRILHSNRQLFEVMVDFWFNHFNVAWNKGDVRWYAPSYERDAIRPHALGKFRDLLGATAKHPAMLVYLDNAMSRSEKDPMMAVKKMERGQKPLRRNENYAREILELHTLGVDGGYSQNDVLEAARVLTGWGIEGANDNTAPVPIAFRFKPWHHDHTQKTVLGETYGPGQGQAEGERLMDRLASHPSTARNIATKLCRRFVADPPPPKLVDKVAKRFLHSQGDIRQTLETLLFSSEFADAKYAQARFKTPLEFAASALRAVGAKAKGFQPVLRYLENAGMPLYTCPPPTGYKVGAQHWVSGSGLLARVNWAWQLCERPYGGWIRFKPGLLIENGPDQEPGKVVDDAAAGLLQAPLGKSSRDSILKRLQDPAVGQVKLGKGRQGVDVKRLLALVLASPEFQKK